MADMLLFGRLANARRARPRRFRLFNAHLEKPGRVVIDFDDHFTCFGGFARCRSTTRLPLHLFLLAPSWPC